MEDLFTRTMKDGGDAVLVTSRVDRKGCPFEGAISSRSWFLREETRFVFLAV